MEVLLSNIQVYKHLNLLIYLAVMILNAVVCP